MSVFNAQTPITPVDYETGTTLDGSPNGTGPWKLGQLRRRPPAPRSSATRTGGAARRRSTARRCTFFDDLGTMVTAIQGGAADAIVQFSVIGGDALLNDPNFTVLEVEAATHRQIWMRCDDRPVRRQGGAPGAGAHVRPRADDRHAVPGPGRDRQRPRHRPVHAVLQRLACRSAPRTSRRPGSCSPTPASRTASRPTLHAVDLQEIPRARPADPGRRGARPASSSRSPSRAATRSTARSGARPSRPTRRAPARPSSASSTTATARRPTCSSTPPSRPAASGTRRSTRTRSSTHAFEELPGVGRRRGPDRGGRNARDDPQRRRARRPAVLLQLPVRATRTAFQGVRVSALGPDVRGQGARMTP